MNDFLDQVKSKRIEYERFATRILVDLVRIPTVNPPGQNYAEALAYVKDVMQNFGLEARLVETPDSYVKETEGLEQGISGPRLNLIATNSSTDPEIILNAHIDTVPAGSGWTVGPFTGEVRDGIIYGRGAADDKSGVATLILLSKILSDFDIAAPPLQITITVDEEIGGEAGLGYLVKKGMVKGKFLLSADGPMEYILAYHNGIYRFNVIVRGKSAHSSMPFRGINAIENTAKIIIALQDYKTKLLNRRSSFKASPDLAMQGFETLYPSLNIGVIRGGTKVNVVPDFCEIEVERRFTPEEGVNQVKSEVSTLLEHVKSTNRELDYELKEIFVKDAVRTDTQDEFVTKVKAAVRDALGMELSVAGTTGATDMSFTSNILRIPSAAFGPIRSDERIHGPDEFVRVSDVVDVSVVYAFFLSSLSF